MKKYKKFFSIALLAVFVFSTGKYLLQMVDNAVSGSSQEQALSMATSDRTGGLASRMELPRFRDPEQMVSAQQKAAVYVPAPIPADPYVEELEQLDLSPLRQVNSDVIGWILIPDTAIHYPVVQGDDNDYYLNYTWDRKYNSAGAIFLESTNRRDMTEFHTILYGHNMVNKTMFAEIRNYTTQDYWQTHPYVYLLTETGIFRYEVYASYEAPVESDTYKMGMNQENTRQSFIDYTMEQSVIETGITPAVTDRILTLSTCSGMGHATRWVIHARLPMVEAPE